MALELQCEKQEVRPSEKLLIYFVKRQFYRQSTEFAEVFIDNDRRVFPASFQLDLRTWVTIALGIPSSGEAVLTDATLRFADLARIHRGSECVVRRSFMSHQIRGGES